MPDALPRGVRRPRVGSLFSGVGGFDLGLERTGWDVAWQVENDRQARSVLRRRWPDVDLFEDVHDVGRSTLAPVDLICGGFPCQDLSVAGKRSGLAGERSGLFHEFMRVVSELAPRWVLIENVPGLLSSVSVDEFDEDEAEDGWADQHTSDFGIVLEALGERGYGWCWRILDSQYFGVAQRRRRVFIVGHLGGFCPPEVLLEPESVLRDSPPSRAAREEVAARVGDGSEGSADRQIAQALPTKYRGDPHEGVDTIVIDRAAFNQGENAQWDPEITESESAPPVVARGPHAVAFKSSHYTRGKDGAPSEVTPPLSADADKGDQDILAFNIYPASGQGSDLKASPTEISTALDGTALSAKTERGTRILQPSTYALRADAGREGKAKTPSPDAEGKIRLRDPGFTVEEERSPTLDAGPPPTVFRKAQKAHDSDDHERWEEAEHANTLSGHGTTASEVALESGVIPLLEVGARTGRVGHEERDGLGVGESGDPMYSLQAGKQHGVAPTLFGSGAGTERVASAGSEADFIVGAIPRRLTPVECERLQGFPDGWTEEGVEDDGSLTMLKDGPRYRMMGNAVTVDVIEWIGERLHIAHHNIIHSKGRP